MYVCILCIYIYRNVHIYVYVCQLLMCIDNIISHICVCVAPASTCSDLRWADATPSPDDCHGGRQSRPHTKLPHLRDLANRSI